MTNGNPIPSLGDPRDPKILATTYLGQAYAPNDQQAAIIGAPCEPMRVIAGAGAGKTETMAARAVWLVINEGIRPEQILGLTFTRKAARELGRRIRERLNNPNILKYFPELRETLAVINPSVMTYDSYFARLIKEYGLLLPTDVDRRLIGEAEKRILIRDHFASPETISDCGFKKVNLFVSAVAALQSELNTNMCTVEEAREETRAFILALPDIYEKDTRARAEIIAVQDKRLKLLDVVDKFNKFLEAEELTTFDIQTLQACQLLAKSEEPKVHELAKYRAVMLDEYQDTSYTQHTVLRRLFGGQQDHLATTAVGDPMQAIYSWRGGASENLINFTQDFRQTDGSPATAASLTTSWRNPGDVLDMANYTLRESGVTGVEPLQPRPGSGPGTVVIGKYDSLETEHAKIVDFIRTQYWEPKQAAESETDPEKKTKLENLTAAVLLRKNKDIMPIARALQEAGIPVQLPPECVTEFAEVKLLVDIATVANDPSDDQALLGLLSHPRFHIGALDILILQQRLEQLIVMYNQDAPSDRGLVDPEEYLNYAIESMKYNKKTMRMGLGDALADLGPKDEMGYSHEGYERLTRIQQMLRTIRQESFSRPLPELFMDIEKFLDLRVELLSSYDPDGQRVATGYLDEFYRIATDFSTIRGATLAHFLDYLEYAKENREISSSPGSVDPNSVQLLTAHSSKGLEWDVVCVPLADSRNYQRDKSRGSYLSSATMLPLACLHNAAGIVELANNHEKAKGKDVISEDFAITGDVAISDTRSIVGQAFLAAENAENVRLFYVAATRSADKLMVSWNMDEKTDGLPVLKHYAETHEVTQDIVEAPPVAPGANDPNINVDLQPAEWLVTYSDNLREEYAAGAQLITEANLERIDSNEQSLPGIWNREVTAVIEEFQREQSTDIDITLPSRFSTSDLVNLSKDRAAFLRNLARPVPLKPNRYAKQGTAFHSWVETQLTTGGGLWDSIDPDDRLEIGEDPAEYGELDDTQLNELKEKFAKSSWANPDSGRQIRYVERGFEIRLGKFMNKGRIDAIFHEGDDPHTGWIVVDWKTGRVPTGADRDKVAIQLAAYRIAAARFLSKELGMPVDYHEIRALFYYVAHDVELEPMHLLDAEELAQLSDIND
ncbi:MAG: UvrD-helicase domain-containing protein [Corynebacterium sp.]|nr:UvrD-helicase domain-containing protein [Corynebacterium sp.]